MTEQEKNQRRVKRRATATATLAGMSRVEVGTRTGNRARKQRTRRETKRAATESHGKNRTGEAGSELIHAERPRITSTGQRARNRRTSDTESGRGPKQAERSVLERVPRASGQREMKF
jgi:hypothetical protein